MTERQKPLCEEESKPWVQAAYDYNAVRRRKALQTQRKADLRVAKGGKRRFHRCSSGAQRHASGSSSTAGGVCHQPAVERVQAGGAERPDSGRKGSAWSVSLKSQYTYYNSTLNSKTSITSVEETAGRLGLMKIDQSQITYIRLGESDTLERTQSAVRQWTDFIYNGAVNILGTVK